MSLASQRSQGEPACIIRRVPHPLSVLSTSPEPLSLMGRHPFTNYVQSAAKMGGEGDEMWCCWWYDSGELHFKAVRQRGIRVASWKLQTHSGAGG